MPQDKLIKKQDAVPRSDVTAWVIQLNSLYARVSPKVVRYLTSHASIYDEMTFILETDSIFSVQKLKGKKIKSFINLRRINDARFVNKFLSAINGILPYNGMFIGYAETMEQRSRRLLRKFPKSIAYPYRVLDFIFKRIFPKWGPTRKLYFFLTQGSNRVMSLPEILGRLLCCGFCIVDYQEIDNLLYFAARKIKLPTRDFHASYGPIFRMRRIGKGGKTIFVYKFRTMHPYAEYLQEYLYNQNSLAAGGKIRNDFRVTRWGRILRRFWIDELPMLFNVLKGDLKIVGPRPLSSHYLSLYRPSLRIRRAKYKPGLVPPFYVDMPKTLDEIMDSEERYLNRYDMNPLGTDIEYFLKAFFNIFIRHARSH